MKKKILIIGSIVLALAIIGAGVFFYLKDNKEEVKPDNVKFMEEYGTVKEDNVFVYRTPKEIIKILENGTGIVYLGFPECPWCKSYVTYLNEVAKENKVKKIYYLNILEDRKNNTDDYKKIVELLKEELQFDEEGNKRVYVPAVIAVKNGEIVGFDDETAWDTKDYKTPEEYWENEDLDGLKLKLKDMIKKLDKNACVSGCNS